MADAAVTVLLEKLPHLLVTCADLVSGAEDEIQQLKHEVESLKLLLQQFANKPMKERPTSEAGREIQDVVYGAELIIDTHLCRAAAAQRKIDLFRRHRTLETEPARSLAEEVRSLRETKVKPILEKLRFYFADVLLIGDGSETNILEERVTPALVTQDTALSIRDEQESMTHRLIEGTEELDVVSVFGAAGGGKTTLAMQIYQSQEIQDRFPTRIWVYVSRNLNMKDVFLTILKEVASKDMSCTSDHELARVVGDFLEKRRFLLVLDDVWNGSHFTAIRDALPKGNRMSSRVLLTTRFGKVCLQANPSRTPHRLRFLTDYESWELLQLEVFGQPNCCPTELISIGKKIAVKCMGLPLAVVILGGMLSDILLETNGLMTSLEQEWKKLFQSLIFQGKGIQIYVEFSYNMLPEDLRNLFLYLGMFPEDYKIPVTTLTCLWIAEGFIQQKEGHSLEEIAEENLNRLIRRKLVLLDERRSNGRVKACRLHDLVRDFCIVKGSELKLFQEIRNPEEGTFDPPILELQRHRRMCIHSNPLDFFSSEPYVPDVRSFSCFCKTETILLPEDTSKIPGDGFKLLRVLHIKPIRFTRFPLQLTQLFCLRYIVLSSDFKILPEAISLLRNIQALIIHTSSRILEIKVDIWKMIPLRHLRTNASIILRKEPEIHSDQELQTLTNLSPDNCTRKVFAQASCLKKLGIRGTLSKLLAGETGSRNFDNLEMLDNLENLRLLNDVHMVSPSEGRLPCLPPSHKFPRKLRSLTLSATFLSWEHMSVLGKLEKLEVLKLKDNAFVGECWEVEDCSFLSLQVLHIGYTNLVSWSISGHSFRCLVSLALRNCEKLRALPHGLEKMVYLREIELLCPTKAVVAHARKIEEERLQMEGSYPRIKLSIFFPSNE